MVLDTTWQLLFAIVALLLLVNYIIFLTTILLYRSTFPFRSVFFTLTLTLGFFDIFEIICTGFFLRLPSMGISSLPLRLPSPVVAIGSSLMWGLAFSQHMSVLAIALNRCSAIVFPHHHRACWNRARTRACLMFIFLSGVVFVLPKVLFSQCEYEIIEPGTLRAVIVWRNRKLMAIYKYVSAVLSILVNCLSFSCYAAIAYVTVKRRTSLPLTTQASNRASAERRIRKRRQESLIPVDRESIASALSEIRTRMFGAVGARAASMSLVEEELRRRKKRSKSRVLMSRSSLRVRQYGGAGARYVEMLREKRELRLALCGFTMFLFGLAFVAGVLLLAVEGDAKEHSASYVIWQATSDLCAGITPILVLAVSRTARRRYLSVITCGRRHGEKQHSSASVATTHTTPLLPRASSSMIA